MKIAITGHKTVRLRGQEKKVAEWIYNELKAAYMENGKFECLCGGAEGTDELFAEIVAFGDLDLDLIFYLPCEGYRYFALEKYMEKAVRNVYMFSKWAYGLEGIRDRKMVDDCDILYAVWDGVRVGGTWDTIKYAQEKRKHIIFIDREVFK